MDVREKLVELLDEAEEWADHKCDELDCETCCAGKMKGNCVQKLMVDRLIDHGVTVQEWISVNDRLPEDDLPKDTKKKMIRCLVYTDKGTIKPCVRQRWERFDGQLVPWQWNKDLYAKPTHWMYYPQPPKGE